MKLSFVIPAYNEELAIRPCVESILREIERTRCDAEIIVVDNASTDGTNDVAKSLPGVKVVKEMRKGIVSARAAGFREAKGELVANIDADTMLPKGWLERVLRSFANDPKLVCLSGPQVYYDLGVVARTLVALWWWFGYLIYLINRHLLGLGSMVQGGNFVIKKRAWEEAGGFDTSIEFYGEDTDVAKRLHPLGHVTFSLSLPIYASGRRLKQEGMVMTGIRYAINYFWVTLFGKPFHFSSTDVRKEGKK